MVKNKTVSVRLVVTDVKESICTCKPPAKPRFTIIRAGLISKGLYSNTDWTCKPETCNIKSDLLKYISFLPSDDSVDNFRYEAFHWTEGKELG